MNKLYNDLKQDVHNVSYWFPKIKDCGIKVPETFIKEIPEKLFPHLFMDKPDEDIDHIYNWIKDELIPNIPKELRGLIFVKNGTFSNKFGSLEYSLIPLVVFLNIEFKLGFTLLAISLFKF